MKKIAIFLLSFVMISLFIVRCISVNAIIIGLILGTFNFFDGAGNQLNLHVMYDVLPYMILGNNEDDDSTITERLIWDYTSNNINALFFDLFSQKPQIVKAYKRGSSLYEYINTIYMSTIDYNRLINKMGVLH